MTTPDALPASSTPDLLHDTQTINPSAPTSNRWLGVGLAVALGTAIVAGVVLLVLKESRELGDAAWFEGKRTATSLMVALNMHKARHRGELHGLISGPLAPQTGTFNYDGESLNRLRHFAATDFTIEIHDATAGTYTIRLVGTRPNSPPGTLTITHTGTLTLTLTGSE